MQAVLMFQYSRSALIAGRSTNSSLGSRGSLGSLGSLGSRGSLGSLGSLGAGATGVPSSGSATCPWSEPATGCISRSSRRSPMIAAPQASTPATTKADEVGAMWVQPAANTEPIT